MIIDNINIASSEVLTTPRELKREIPVTAQAANTVFNGRVDLRRDWEILKHLFVLVLGPCSVHDPAALLHFLSLIDPLREAFGDKILFVARVFVEKHRSGLNWPGLLSDPRMDGSYDLELGLRLCRQLLIEVNEMGYPVAMEVIDPLVGAYLGDLLTFAIEGARSVEHQHTRYLASGESAVIGAKNATNGYLGPAIEALKIAGKSGLPFAGPNEDGQYAKMTTKGNPGGFLILRGGHEGPNYGAIHVMKTAAMLKKAGLPPRALVDFNHANGGDPLEQARVWREIIAQFPQTRPHLAGAVTECFTSPGKQAFDWPNQDPETLDPDTSITDECIGYPATVELIEETYEALV